MRSARTAEAKAVRIELLEARKRAGLTQQALAKRLARPQSYIAKYEGGERRLDVAEFLLVLRALGEDAPTAIRRIIRAAGAADLNKTRKRRS